MFLMWLGEQIDEYGIGNGISLIIMAGIVSRMPWAILQVLEQYTNFEVGVAEGQYGPGTLVFLIAAFVFVVAGAILITQGQRRIPIQQAKQMRGRRMYGGAAAVSAAAGEPRRRDADHLRIELDDVSADHSSSRLHESRDWQRFERAQQI